ncbi:hypothetical protein SS50377_24720 [Spironucleus salmonicida]|uniref:Uncharacterized protein n=1 Tax=Spironucleus salmonicida TaxID=348837 RepID=V6LLG7_9EUKA|nr:hypothetical protein SS50377_24720 [Spironucleus salmonicida]|eukprot:EST44601.1 Hypothetical protein SS50377_15606 [Spironucleus salmonicida]
MSDILFSTLILSEGNAKGGNIFAFQPKKFKVPLASNYSRSVSVPALKRQAETPKLQPYFKTVSEKVDLQNQKVDNGIKINDRIISKLRTLDYNTDSFVRNPDEERISIIKEIYSKIQNGAIQNQTSTYNYTKTAQIERQKRHQIVQKEIEKSIRTKSERVRDTSQTRSFRPQALLVQCQNEQNYHITNNGNTINRKFQSKKICEKSRSNNNIGFSIEVDFGSLKAHRPFKKLNSSVANKRYDLNYIQQNYKKYYSNQGFKANIQSVEQGKKDQKNEEFKFKSTISTLQSASTIRSQNTQNTQKTFLTQKSSINLDQLFNIQQ